MSIYRHDIASHSSGILFAEDFDLADAPPAIVEAVPEPAPVPPVYSSEQLADACAEAYAEGRQRALAEAAEQHRARCSAALATIADRLAAADENAGAAIDQAAHATAQVIMTTLWVLLPETCARHEHLEVAALVRCLFKDISPYPAIEVSVAPCLADSVRAELQTLPSKLRHQIRVIGDEDLAEGESEVIWKDSKAVRSRSRVLGEIEAALRKLDLISLPDPRAAAQGQASGATALNMEHLDG